MSTRLIKITALVAAIFPISGMFAFAQETVAPAPAVAQPEAAAKAAEEPKAVVTKGKDTLSVDFPDEEIRNVLRNVADLFELNLVIPETLQGKTSIKLRDVTWRQIYQVVLQPVGYTFVEDANIIKVVTIESLNLEPLTTEVFILNYAKASEIKPSLDSLVDAKVGGKIVVDARSNSLVVTERASAIQKVRPIITNLDKSTEQVMIESKFIEVNNNDVKNLGVNWTSLSEYGITAQPTNTVVRGGRAVPRDDDGKLLVPDIGGGAASTMFSAVFSAPEFNVLISALNTGSDSKLVSNPTIVTLNNTEASINVGTEYPIPNYTYNQERGSFEVSGFIYKPIGVIMKVTPQVNNQGFIKLNIAPEVSNQTGTVVFGASGGSAAEIPIIAVQKTLTQVTLKDGFTLGIGGMVTKSELKNTSKVPVLGSIPYLGRLFKSDSTDVGSKNLLIFITARTLKPDGATVGDVFDPRMTREMKLNKDDLPGFRDGSDPFYTPPPPTPEETKKKSLTGK